MSRPAAIVAIACAGLAVAVGIAMVASSLGSQPIGISEEPADAGSRLAAPQPAELGRPRARPENDASPVAPASTQTTSGRDDDRVARDDSDDRDREDEAQDDRDRDSGRDDRDGDDDGRSDGGSSDDSGSDD